MAEGFGVELLGLPELGEFFQVCEKNEFRHVMVACKAGAKVYLKAIRIRCPVRIGNPKKTYLGTYRVAGNLKKSFKIKVLKQKEPGKCLVLVGPMVGKKAKNDGWYGRIVEDGHKNMKKNGMRQDARFRRKVKLIANWEYGGSDTQPHAFVRPAYDESTALALAAYEKSYIENAFETVIKDLDDVADILMED